jgi:hypothetical protein
MARLIIPPSNGIDRSGGEIGWLRRAANRMTKREEVRKKKRRKRGHTIS